MKNKKQLFEDFSQLSILVVGDVMIDRYLSGKVDRISPEAPVPVVRFESSEDRLGGAANVALNIGAMEANCVLCSVIGKDENGKNFLDLLPKHSLSAEGIMESDYRQTTVKTRIISSNQHLLRVDREDTFGLVPEEESAFIQKIKTLLDQKSFDVILFQDYNKGVLTSNVIKEIIAESLEREIPTIVDPKKDNFLAYKGVTLFKPNLKEVREGLGIRIEPVTDSLKEASSQLRHHLNNKYNLITLSEKGLYIDDEKEGHLFPTQARNIADVCGAGDTVVSLAALGLGLKLPIEEIAVLSNLGGGQVCEKVGVVPVDKCQLLAEYEKFSR